MSTISPHSTKKITTKGNTAFSDVIVLTVKSAKHLKYERKSTNSPSSFEEPFYFRVWTSSTRENKLKTRTNIASVEGTVGAVWNQTFQMGVANVDDEFMFVEVRTRNENVVGRVKVCCHEIGRESNYVWLRIYNDNNEEAGEVEVGLFLETYIPKEVEPVEEQNSSLCNWCSFF